MLDNVEKFLCRLRIKFLFDIKLTSIRGGCSAEDIR
jgi:hypothetical protein